MIITVLNYDIYQEGSKPKNDTETTETRHRYDTINKNVKNVKKQQAITENIIQGTKYINI